MIGEIEKGLLELRERIADLQPRPQYDGRQPRNEPHRQGNSVFNGVFAFFPGNDGDRVERDLPRAGSGTPGRGGRGDDHVRDDIWPATDDVDTASERRRGEIGAVRWFAVLCGEIVAQRQLPCDYFASATTAAAVIQPRQAARCQSITVALHEDAAQRAFSSWEAVSLWLAGVPPELDRRLPKPRRGLQRGVGRARQIRGGHTWATRPKDSDGTCRASHTWRSSVVRNLRPHFPQRQEYSSMPSLCGMGTISSTWVSLLQHAGHCGFLNGNSAIAALPTSVRPSQIQSYSI
jgi:hypothetical protein